jgi:hypothetical protein
MHHLMKGGELLPEGLNIARLDDNAGVLHCF